MEVVNVNGPLVLYPDVDTAFVHLPCNGSVVGLGLVEYALPSLGVSYFSNMQIVRYSDVGVPFQHRHSVFRVSLRGVIADDHTASGLVVIRPNSRWVLSFQKAMVV